VDDDRQRLVDNEQMPSSCGRDVRLGAVLRAAFLPGSWARSVRTVGAAALVGGVAASLLPVRGTRATPVAAEPWTRWEWLSLGAVALVSLRQFGWLVFEREGDLLTLIPHKLRRPAAATGPTSSTRVRRELLAGEPDPDQDRLRYPLGVDLLTAVFVQLGARLEVVLARDGSRGLRSRGSRFDAGAGPSR